MKNPLKGTVLIEEQFRIDAVDSGNAARETGVEVPTFRLVCKGEERIAFFDRQWSHEVALVTVLDGVEVDPGSVE
jgi:hypothetical protein